VPDQVPRLPADNPYEVVREYFRRHYPKILAKVSRQVRRSPRRQTGRFQTNRASRWRLNHAHPDYTSAEQIPLIEGKLLAQILEFDDAPVIPDNVREAAGGVMGIALRAGNYRCPISGRHMSFRLMLKEARSPVAGVSRFHVGHIRPKAKGGQNLPDNTYWTTDLGNRIQGDKTWQETVRVIVEMAEFHRRKDGDIAWGELVNRYLEEDPN
jgi:hypothetical protein